MLEPSTLIRKLITELTEQHPGWSSTKIARHIDKTKPDLVNDLLRTRRDYIFRWWVTDVVGESRREQREKVELGEMLAAISPDGDRRLIQLGDMTGYQIVEMGRRYQRAGVRLSHLGNIYVELGELAGRRKLRNVDNPRVEELLEELKQEDD